MTENFGQFGEECDEGNEQDEIEVAKALGLMLSAPESIMSDEEKAIIMIVAVLNYAKSFEEVCTTLKVNTNEGFKILNMMEDCGAITINPDGSWICNYRTTTLDKLDMTQITCLGEGVCDLTKEDEDFVSKFLDEN